LFSDKEGGGHGGFNYRSGTDAGQSRPSHHANGVKFDETSVGGTGNASRKGSKDESDGKKKASSHTLNSGVINSGVADYFE